MTITDGIFLAGCAFMIYRGSRLGFMGAILGPIALILATIVSAIYYLLTKNVPVSLAIGLLGPILLAWLFRFLLKSWSKLTNPEGKLSLLSRLGGALLSLLWGIVMMVLFLLLVAMAPPMNKPLQAVSKDVHHSVIYKEVIKPLEDLTVDKNAPHESLDSLSKDARIQEILNDPEIAQAIQKKDYAVLMANPKIMALVQDPKMVQRMMSVYREKAQEPEQ